LIHFYKRYIEEKQMSDYYDYDDDSEYDDDLSDGENYAGAYGGYDDLYDDVMEEAGYDAWDIYNPEFNFDEERPLFEFDPYPEYYNGVIRDERGITMMTYQALGKLSEMTARLLQAWEKRSTTADHSESPDVSEVCLRYQARPGMKLYQLEDDERRDLRTHSVWNLKRVLGGHEEVMKLKEAVNNIFNFAKRVLLSILENSFPRPMPYPVMKTILSYLLPDKGAGHMGLVSNDEVKEVEEGMYMDRLYITLAKVYDRVKRIMFNTKPLESEVYKMYEDKSILVETFESLVAAVDSSQLQLSFED